MEGAGAPLQPVPPQPRQHPRQQSQPRSTGRGTNRTPQNFRLMSGCMRLVLKSRRIRGFVILLLFALNLAGIELLCQLDCSRHTP